MSKEGEVLDLLVIPAGENPREYMVARHHVVALTIELAVLEMARRDLKEFSNPELAYDAYTHSKKPDLVKAAVPCPSAEELEETVLEPEGPAGKGCGCGTGGCSHEHGHGHDKEAQKSVEDRELKQQTLAFMLGREGVTNPSALANRILEFLFDEADPYEATPDEPSSWEFSVHLGGPDTSFDCAIYAFIHPAGFFASHGYLSDQHPVGDAVLEALGAIDVFGVIEAGYETPFPDKGTAVEALMQLGLVYCPALEVFCDNNP